MNRLKHLFVLLLFSSLHSLAFAQQPTAAVLDIHTAGMKTTPQIAGDLLRIELKKKQHYMLLDKFDVADMLRESGQTPSDCYGKECLSRLGKTLGVEKMISGNTYLFGNKIVIELKVIDVASGKIEFSEVTEFINLEEELQTMFMICINNMLHLENDEQIVNNLIHYHHPGFIPVTKATNTGFRMGFTFIGGEKGQRLADPLSTGGYDSYPTISQFGYQVESQYLSAGNLQGLFEMLFMVGGLEQGMFIPSATFMNGFRHKETGWEIAFGPSINVQKVGRGFYDTEAILGGVPGEWYLKNAWELQDTSGNPLPNPYELVDRIDSRGELKLSSSWIWAIGKTFKSGYLNIPVNAYVAPSKQGWHYGLSFGLNVRKRDRLVDARKNAG